MRALLLPALVLLGCTSPERTSAPASTSTPAPEAAPPPALSYEAPPPRAAYEAPTDVDLSKLLADYKANELRADGLYKGKVIRAHGVAGQVGKGVMGEPFVSLGTGAQFEIPTVQCFLSNPADPEALALSAGGKATIQGRVDRLLGNVIVKDCMVNPMAHLCSKLQAAAGGKRCTTDPASGDANGLVLVDDPKAKKGVVVFLGYAPNNGTVPLADAYALFTGGFAKKAGNVVVGSPRSGYFAVLAMAGSKDPIPDDLRVKIQAFYEAL